MAGLLPFLSPRASFSQGAVPCAMGARSSEVTASYSQAEKASLLSKA